MLDSVITTFRVSPSLIPPLEPPNFVKLAPVLRYGTVKLKSRPVKHWRLGRHQGHQCRHWPVLYPSPELLSFDLLEKGDALAGLEAPSNLWSEHQRWED